MRRTVGALVAVVLATVSLNALSGGPAATAATGPCAAWMDPAKPAAKRADALVAAMSADQKMHMLTFSDPPWFLYYAPGGTHSPHNPTKEWVEKFKGKFDMGWNAMRDEIFANQKRLG